MIEQKDRFIPAISFGRLDPKTEHFQSGRILSGREAYECWHLNLYLREIIQTRLSPEAHLRQDRNEFLRCIQTLHGGNSKHFVLAELGSSLGEIIDGFEFIKQRYFNNNPFSVEFHGIETSALFREVTRVLHPKSIVKLYESVEDYICNTESESLVKEYLVDRAVSSYAFSSTRQFSDFITRFDICFLQIFGFANEEKVVEDTVGTQLRYFNLAELGERLVNLNYLYGKKRPTRPKELDDNEDCYEAFYVYFSDKEIQSEFAKLLLENDFFNQKIRQEQILPPSPIKALSSIVV